MARTESNAVELGTIAPDFALPDPSTGRTVSLDDFPDARGYCIAFICNHCPFVQLIRHEFARFGRAYSDQGMAVIAINSNDAKNFPEDSPEKMRDEARRFGYTFPYLFDETQEVARAYQAACTPDFFLFDADRRLVYHGQFDDARPGSDVPVTGQDLRAAADALLEGRPVPAEQRPSLGCNIKWKEGA
ncbi:Peroxiredoxin [Ectothiorhodospira mobilis]|uniref:Peroxiredoxin n=1 Tax=Ectothiorhodospira mobilis TaxID=195064 RepID=A0A1I4R348_ECTMO|nr:thioredoxin family protein [Ectothiorhodospira mobilis]SFM46360.1 Peroxiredoxin [Ectothiorhodospira mobilis]